MSLKAIKDLLKVSIGMNVSSVGASNFERAVRQRMKACGIDDVGEYLAYLNDTNEMDELIDEVIVPETWFFRNHQSFSALEEFVTKQWRPRNLDRKLMVASIPCSTGEEPYSIAMTLDQMGMALGQYQIDAVDISPRLLTKARRGVYGRHSFRNKDNTFRDRYFDYVGGTYMLRDNIRNAVNFQRANLLDKYFGVNGAIYDVIFCRNLLIYFDRETQDIALRKLHHMLIDTGMLMLGHAETPEFIRGHFIRAEYPRAFGYIKSSAAPAKKAAASALNPVTPKAAPLLPATGPKRDEFLKTVELKMADALPQTDAQVLREAARLANEGKLKEAGSLCEKYLRQHPASAQAYYLLGLVREGEGKHNLVAELFQKAVYLDPNHYEAMIHLALHLARYGDADSAKKLQQRAQRVITRKKE